MNKYLIFSVWLILICPFSSLYSQYDGVYMYKTINETDWEQINIVNGQVSYSYAQQKKGAILLSKVGINGYKFPGLSQLYTLTTNGIELTFYCEAKGYNHTFYNITSSEGQWLNKVHTQFIKDIDYGNHENLVWEDPVFSKREKGQEPIDSDFECYSITDYSITSGKILGDNNTNVAIVACNLMMCGVGLINGVGYDSFLYFEKDGFAKFAKIEDIEGKYLTISPSGLIEEDKDEYTDEDAMCCPSKHRATSYQLTVLNGKVGLKIISSKTTRNN